jgi:filamentous hemagglutinin
VQQLLRADSLTQLAADPAFSAYATFTELDQRYPVLFSDYRVRRGNGFTPTSVLPIVYGDVLDESLGKAFPEASVRRGSIDSFLTAIQSDAGGGIDLVAPNGDITVGLTTPRQGRDIGVLTTAGGDIRSMLSGNFNINQGKVVTAQGGDILIYSSRGNIDAGRGARTSQTTPAPVREPIVDGGVVVGFLTRIPAGFSGSGIQTLSSDPDGQGPLPAAKAGTVRLFTPSGFVDAGEAGIVSGGDLVIVAQTVLNAANISAGGASVGVPVAASGSLASSVATSGGANTTASKAGEEAAAASAAAARAASATAPRPAILVVEVLGFGDKNCKEGDKDCFAK